MSDLSTKYLGLALKNPIIVGASALTANLDSIKRLEDAGAGALVTKSLFEEEIQLEHFLFDEDQQKGSYRHPEMITVRPRLEFGGPAEHLQWVQKAKAAVKIPVIASLNAVQPATWLDYARQLAGTGVDALECNLFASPKAIAKPGGEIENEQVALVQELKRTVAIPLSVKLSFFYTNPGHIIQRLDAAGADGFVLFNRLFEPDLDIEAEQPLQPFNLSHNTDYRLALRYTGLLEGAIRADICGSTGIFTGADIVKMLLAGATAIQTVSALFKHGYAHLPTMLADVRAWMERKGYQTPADFRGKLSQRHSKNPWVYTHGQYIRLMMNPDKIVNNIPNPISA